jgi:hypothetical protein
MTFNNMSIMPPWFSNLIDEDRADSGNRQNRAINREPTAATAVLIECNNSFLSMRSHVNIF